MLMQCCLLCAVIYSNLTMALENWSPVTSPVVSRSYSHFTDEEAETQFEPRDQDTQQVVAHLKCSLGVLAPKSVLS